MRQQNRTTQNFAVATAVLLALGVFFLRTTPLLQRLEYISSDARTNSFRDNALLDETITIVDIDDASMQELGPWAWPRRMHGQLVAFLDEKGARSISFDVLFVEKDLSNLRSDRAFAELLRGTPSCLAMMFHSGEIFSRKQGGPDRDVQRWAISVEGEGQELEPQVNVAAPDALFAEAVRWVAPIDVGADSDGVFRRRIALRNMNGRYYSGIDIATAAMLKGVAPEDIIYRRGEWVEFRGQSARDGGPFRIPLDQEGRMRLNYYGDSFSFSYLPYYRILQAYRWEKRVIHYRELSQLLGRLFKREVRQLLEEDPGEETWAAATQMIAAELLQLLGDDEEFSAVDTPQRAAEFATLLDGILGAMMEAEETPAVFEGAAVLATLRAHFERLLSEKVVSGANEPRAAYARFIQSLRGRIFLVGSTSKELHDQRVTPFDAAAPGVEIVATGINNILAEDFLIEAGSLFLLIALLVLAWLVSSVTLLFSAARAALIVCAIALGYSAVSIGLYRWWDYLIPLFAPLLVMAISYVTALVVQQVIEGKERGLLKQTFGRFISPALVQQIMQNPSMVQLGGETRQMSVSFSGMVDFSRRCADLTPTQVVELLQQSHTRMTETILHSNGTLDKFEGDTIMAFWGAPVPSTDHALRGCCAILDNLKHLEEMNRGWVAKGWQPLSMEAGLNSGSMVVGNIGSQEKMNYSIIGDAVNTAARVRGANKIYGTSFVITHFTWLQIKDELVTRLLDPILFIGKSEPIPIYEVLCRRSELSAELEDKLRGWREAKEAYLARDWDLAEQLFAALQNSHGEDGPSQLFVQRIAEYRLQPPPAEWDGRYVMQTK